MGITEDALAALQSSFTLQRVGTGPLRPGEPIDLALTSPDASLRVPVLTTGDLDLTLITKQVTFLDKDPVDPDALRDPVANLAALGLDAGIPARVLKDATGTFPLTVESIGSAGSVAGALTQIAGTVPIAVEVPVSFSVEWSVTRDDTGETAPVVPSTGTQVGTTLPVSSAELDASLALPLVAWTVRATVTLSAGGVAGAPFTLSLPLVVPAVPTLTAAIAVQHPGLAATRDGEPGWAFVAVPEASPIRALDDLLDVLALATDLLAGLPPLTPWTSVANGYAAILTLLETIGKGNVPLVRADEIPKFRDIKWGPSGPFDRNANNDVGSVAMLGADGARTRWFKDDKLAEKSGDFTLETGASLHALVPDLARDEPDVSPADATLTVGTHANDPVGVPKFFYHCLSSLKFV
ncbi:MAG: hypothetical protein ACOZNI_14470 [Myxococcota bacterium]